MAVTALLLAVAGCSRSTDADPSVGLAQAPEPSASSGTPTVVPAPLDRTVDAEHFRIGEQYFLTSPTRFLRCGVVTVDGTLTAGCLSTRMVENLPHCAADRLPLVLFTGTGRATTRCTTSRAFVQDDAAALPYGSRVQIGRWTFTSGPDGMRISDGQATVIASRARCGYLQRAG